MKNENLYTMKQPDLGKKISELRKQKGLTQEELVEQCNINVRTIQRIEAGEVTPRSYTLKNILNVLGGSIQDFSFDDLIELKEKDLQKIKIGWFSGILVAVISLVMILGEVYISANHLSEYGFSFRVITSILLLVSLLFFLNSYRLIGVVSNNKTLQIATYFYWFLTLVFCVANVFVLESEDFSRSLFLFQSILLLLIPFGLSEIFLGVGVTKLKNTFGTFSKVVGILKIVNGALVLSLIFSVVGIFLVIPVLILELINLNEIIKKLRPVNHS